MNANDATLRDGVWSDPFACFPTPRPMRSSCRANLSELTARVALVWGAPPGVYEHTRHEGLAIYMAMSRKVGSIDVGEGELAMKAQAGEFIVGLPGAAARMHSFRGGHWGEVVLADASLGYDPDRRGPGRNDLRRLHRSFHKKREIGDLLTQIVRGGLSARAPEPLFLDTLGCALVDALDRYFDAEVNRRREVGALSKRTVEEILYYMDAHLAEPIGLRDLAGLAGLSRARFVKAFKNAAGESPYQALIRRRLEAARFALMTGEKSISEISLACGFSSQQHMTGLFSTRFGIAPAAFRNQIRAA
ncbi:MAG: AraC family transcriptional regulator [Pseudomonadota bacterium]